MNTIPRLCLRIIALSLSSAAAPVMANDFVIAPLLDSGTFIYHWNVSIDGTAAGLNPTLFLARGQSYSFTVNTNAGHPFYFKTISSIGTANAYIDGVSVALPVTSGTPFTFAVPMDAPEELFYNCSVHSSMAGTIEVVVFRNGFD